MAAEEVHNHQIKAAASRVKRQADQQEDAARRQAQAQVGVMFDAGQGGEVKEEPPPLVDKGNLPKKRRVPRVLHAPSHKAISLAEMQSQALRRQMKQAEEARRRYRDSWMEAEGAHRSAAYEVIARKLTPLTP